MVSDVEEMDNAALLKIEAEVIVVEKRESVGNLLVEIALSC